MERPQNSLQDVDVRFDDLSLQDVDVRFDDLPFQDVDLRFDNLSLQDVDVRFDNLPDRAVHHILCFLRLSDLARLSAVSKRCRELCISNPNLRNPKLGFKNMDLGSNKSRGSRVNNFLDRFMALRCLYGVKTQSFRLRWSFERSGKDEEHLVETWLQQAINSGASKVRLKVVHPGKPFALPLCVLGCDSLRVDAGEGFLKFPKVPYFATKLRSLALGPFRMEKDCNIGELLSSFKSLKKLRLEKIRGIKKINITSSSIEILAIVSSDRKLCDIDIQLEKLYDLFLVWTPKYPKSISLKISAPNLQTFHLAGYALDHYCMRDSPDLLHATIGLKLPAKSRGNQASIKDNFNKVLHSVQKARRLNLLDIFVEALFKHGCLPFSFDNVEYLAVGRTSSGDQVLPLSSLLRGTTNLKHLSLYVASVSKKVATVINSIPSRELSFNMEDWQSQNLMFTHHQLKKVTVELFDRENEVELMKYLLKNAEELEVMAILYTSPVSSDLVTELRKYKKRPSTELHLSSTIPYNKRRCIRPDRRPM